MLRDLDLPWPHGSCIRFFGCSSYVLLISSLVNPRVIKTPGRVVLFLGCSKRVFESLFLTTYQHHLVHPQRPPSALLPIIPGLGGMGLPCSFIRQSLHSWSPCFVHRFNM